MMYYWYCTKCKRESRKNFRQYEKAMRALNAHRRRFCAGVV